ncbi:MAG: glycosyltransferase family 2 protein, partial [Alistipes sp.]|nr:glycosyltransferase family 2 protein [Alistipes sp.]
AALSYAVKGNFRGAWAVARAYADFVRWHSRLARERRQIRSTAVAPGCPNTLFRGSIVLRYMFGKRKFEKLM